MRELILEGQGHPLVREHAERAVSGLPPGQPVAEARAVYDYVGQRTEYRRDPIINEWIRTPWHMLGEVDAYEARQSRKRPQLDCDDLTVLSLAMLASIGFDVAIRVVSTRPDRQYNHVYGLAVLGARTVVPIDLTRYRLPRTAPWPAESRAFELVA